MLTPIHYAVFAAGLTLGGALAGAGGWFYNQAIENPAIVRQTKAVCLADAQTAASQARLEQWRRNQKVIDQMNANFAEISRRRVAEDAQIDREMDDEIKAFEDSGRSVCSVSLDNYEFLQPSPAARP